MNNKKQNKLSFEERQIRRRNQKENALRFKNGIKELFSKKLKFTIFSLYVISIIFIWFLFVYTPNDYENILKLLIYIVFWLFFGICALGILLWYGKPKNAQKIEDDIKDILNIKEEHKVPILDSIIKKENGIIAYKFYSPDYSEDKFEEKRSDIEQKLGIKILNKIESHGKFICFDSISKKSIKLMDVLNDDRI